MTKGIIASVLAAALAFTPMTAAPAQARDTHDALGIILGLGIVAAIANQHSKNRNNRAQTVNRNRNHNTFKPVQRQQRQHRRNLPQQCLRNFRTDFGRIQAYGSRCLSNNMRNVSRLPSSCERYIYTPRGQRTVFSPACLRNNGFRG
jgi:predicted membrane chloride channel (bestrophin family)